MPLLKPKDYGALKHYHTLLIHNYSRPLFYPSVQQSLRWTFRSGVLRSIIFQPNGSKTLSKTLFGIPAVLGGSGGSSSRRRER